MSRRGCSTGTRRATASARGAWRRSSPSSCSSATESRCATPPSCGRSPRGCRASSAMDAELQRWKDRGQWFDYLGFEVFYLAERSGPHLLLVHGYPFSSFDWVRIWPALGERFSLIAPDMLGMGFSAKPARYEYSVHDHADMHEALLAHRGVTECHVL